jgi:predicted DNA-binding transcriptional regulator AlpA
MKVMKKTLGERLERAYYTIDELAEFLRIEPGTVRNRMSKGIGPKPTKIGHRVLFEEKDIREYLERCESA